MAFYALEHNLNRDMSFITEVDEFGVEHIRSTSVFVAVYPRSLRA